MKKKTSAPPAIDFMLRKRNPLITLAGAAMIRTLREHPHAPRWNHAAGDRVDREDLRAVRRFAGDLETQRGTREAAPPPAILRRVAGWIPQVIAFRRAVPPGLDPETGWERIPTTSREDVATRPGELMPDDVDLARMIAYRTAGTTGHALLVPHDPRAVACYGPLLEFGLARHGIRTAFSPKTVACFLVGAQARTVTFPTVLSAWNNAGFAKLNLRPSEWPTPESPHAYFRDMAPFFLTGDPISFSEMKRLEIPARPAAMVTTAVAMSAALKKRLQKSFGCPVIDWYSLTETGPIAYSCPHGHGYHLLPPDLYIEALDPSGRAVPPGTRGEITVTGGRNPFLPLLRYRTGDWGRLDFGRCACGDPMPRILDLEGRAPVIFRASDGSVVNPVDLSRVLREFPFVQHEFTQRASGTFELAARMIPGLPRPRLADLERPLRALLGPDAEIGIRFDARLGDRKGKVVPYRSEMLLED